jgi:hypothetical protein
MDYSQAGNGTYCTVDAQMQIGGRITPLTIHLGGRLIDIEEYTVKEDNYGPWLECFGIKIDDVEHNLYLSLDKLNGFRLRWFVRAA